LRPALSVITNIDLDHTDILGDTLGAIAREKAGIFKPGTPALSAVTQDEARTAIAAVADEVGAPLHELRDEGTWTSRQSDLTGSVLTVETPLRRYDDLTVSLPGRHQQGNAVLALRAAELVLPTLKNDPQPAHDGLRDVRGRTGFRGRLEVLRTDPLVIVDVAHNPPGIRATLDTVAPAVADRSGTLHVCLNAVRGKGLDDTARMLADCGAVVTPIPIDTDRALPPDEIADRLRAQGVTTRAPRALSAALNAFVRTAAPEDVLLLIGSHKLVEVLPDDWA
ncbi:MAG: cyanophycin synthetase, partial [Salinibacter sp.]